MRKELVVAVSAIAICVGIAGCGASQTSGGPTNDAAKTEESSTDSKSSASSDAQSEKPIGVSINLSDDSILTFDGNAASAQLVDNMHDAKPPKSCTVRYDQMGALPTVTTTDARTIREVYKRLARMHVEGESNMSMTDNYHLVAFELQDGTKVSFNFEGEGILVRDGQNYSVTDDGKLWPYVRQLQEQYLREKKAGTDELAITVDDKEELVTQCPTSAPAGETVRVGVFSVLDAELHVSVNGDEHFGEFVTAEQYEFVMPSNPVTVRVWTSSDGYPGS